MSQLFIVENQLFGIIMARLKNQKGPVRMTDALAFKVTPQHREAVERYAEQYKMGICEAARELLNAGIKARGIE
jgi:hypothetical protein